MAELLSMEQVNAALAGLTGWAGDTSAISRTVEAPSFLGRHPARGGGRRGGRGRRPPPRHRHPVAPVTFTLSTHSAGGVTDQDTALARRIDELAEAHQAT